MRKNAQKKVAPNKLLGHKQRMNNTKYVNRALRLLVEAKGKREAIRLLMEQGLSSSTAEKLARRKYKIKMGGVVHRAIAPVLDQYKGKAS